MTKVDLINDEYKLVAHRVIARMIGYDPSLLDMAHDKIIAMQKAYGDIDFICEWRTLLECNSPLQVRRELTSRTENNYRLRISSPFNTMSFPPFDSEDFRRRVWKVAKRLVESRLRRSEEDNQ